MRPDIRIAPGFGPLRALARRAAALLALPAAVAAAPETPVELRFPMSRQEVVLVGLENNEVAFRTPGRDTGGRAYMDLDELRERQARIHADIPESFREAVERLERGDALGALPDIRPLAERFVPYLALGDLAGNLGRAVSVYLKALAAAGRWDEVVALVERVPVARAPAELTERLARIAPKMTAEAGSGALARVRDHLLAQEGYGQAQIADLMDLANHWREAEQYESARALFAKLEGYDGPGRLRARLFAAYCAFRSPERELDPAFLQDPPAIEADAPEFGLRELVLGLARLRDDAVPQAMRHLARGKTYANSGDPWYSELLHTVADAYERLGDNAAARATHRETALLFPNDRWGGRSQSWLDARSKEASPDNESSQSSESP